MSTNPTEATNGTTPAAAPKVKTVGEDMASRRIFANIGEASEYLSASADLFDDFGAQTIAAPGMDDEGNFDPAIYGDSPVMVALLRNARKVKAIVVAPIPSTDSLLASEAGRQWVEKILQKELNHVAVRHLRDAEDVSTVVDQIPTTLEGYITSGREGDGGIMESFNELYKLINATLAKAYPVWNKQRFTKQELKKALESKGYALEYYSTSEDYKGQSLFAAALQLGINAAKRKGFDPTIFERWAATRDAKVFNPADDDEDEIDLDSLTDAMLTEATPAADAEPAAEPAAA